MASGRVPNTSSGAILFGKSAVRRRAVLADAVVG